MYVMCFKYECYGVDRNFLAGYSESRICVDFLFVVETCPFFKQSYNVHSELVGMFTSPSFCLCLF